MCMFVKKGSILAAVFAVVAMASSAQAQEIKLCTGSNSGVYYEAGLDIAKAAGRFLKVTPEESQGTSENIDRTLYAQTGAVDSCDAFIGQPDGMVNEVRSTPAVSRKVRQVGTLHREYLHVVCGKNSGIDDLGDLEGDASKYSIAVGEEGSGAWLVWQNLIAEDEDYAPVRVVKEGGAAALSSVAAGDTTCALITAGLGNGTMNDADQMFADDLKLVGANDRDFDDAVGIDGKPLYEYAKIDGVYKNMQCGWTCGSVSTLSWLARVYVSTDKVTDNKVRDQFIKAVAQGGQSIKGKYGK